VVRNSDFPLSRLFCLYRIGGVVEDRGDEARDGLFGKSGRSLTGQVFPEVFEQRVVNGDLDLYILFIFPTPNPHLTLPNLYPRLAPPPPSLRHERDVHSHLSTLEETVAPPVHPSRGPVPAFIPNLADFTPVEITIDGIGWPFGTSARRTAPDAEGFTAGLGEGSARRPVGDADDRETAVQPVFCRTGSLPVRRRRRPGEHVIDPVLSESLRLRPGTRLIDVDGSLNASLPYGYPGVS